MEVVHPKQPKNLDPSDKMDLDFWDCFGRENPILQLNETRLIDNIWKHGHVFLPVFSSPVGMYRALLSLCHWHEHGRGR